MSQREEERVVDASIFEGGGQIFRISLGLASLLQFPCEIHSIRSGRPNPGLAKQHMTVAAIIESLGFGRIEGIQLGSSMIRYTPRNMTQEPNSNRTRIEKDVGSAGSISLIVQALLPYFIFQPHPTELILKGGTNVSFSPPIDHLDQVLLPLLSRMGVQAQLSPEIKRGYFPQGGGKIQLNIENSSCLRPLDCTHRGLIESVSCIIVGDESPTTEELKPSLKALLEETLSNYFLSLAVGESAAIISPLFQGVICHIVSSTTQPEPTSSSKKGPKEGQSRKNSKPSRKNNNPTSLGAQVRIQTSTNNILSVNILFCEKCDPENLYSIPEKIGSDLVTKIGRLIESGCCVDEQTADQLLIYMALASAVQTEQEDGFSRLLCEPFREGSSSLHLETTVYLLNHLLGPRGCNIAMVTAESGCRLITCRGIGYRSGNLT